ncbi:MAG: glycoside hydrolase TIM-barrel-like domain-containing protein, partial [Pseudomonadota bacterium]
NIEGGEGFDWYYHSTEAREAQIRTPIEDGAYGEPWVFRYKDLRNWWGEYHHNRIGGVRAQFPTEWEPQSKPFWFTEYGCAAIDKATNEPNKFLDTKSSESSEPVFSNGQRDPLIQLQYVRAMTGYWAQGDTNPTSVEYGGPMVDMTRAHLWAWDARPYPYFPALTDLWSDGENYVRGHWVTGRSSARPLASVVAEICARSGLDSVDVSDLHGFVRGYHVPDVSDARAALQPLMLAYGFDAIERDGVLRFSNRSLAPRADVAADTLVQGDDAPVLNLERAAEPEVAGRVQVGFIDVDGDFEAATSQAIFPDERTVTLEQTELNLALTRNEARQIAERWLAEARVARDVAQF